jgi:anti-anti-sigma factor
LTVKETSMLDEDGSRSAAESRGACWMATDSIADGVALIRFGGELDIAAASGLGERVHEATTGAEGVVIDLTELTFIDSTGIALLLAAGGLGPSSNGNGRKIALAAPTAQVERVIELTGLSSTLPIRPSVDEAARHVGIA